MHVCVRVCVGNAIQTRDQDLGEIRRIFGIGDLSRGTSFFTLAVFGHATKDRRDECLQSRLSIEPGTSSIVIACSELFRLF